MEKSNLKKDGTPKKRMGRHEKEIDDAKLKGIMRMKPTLKDTAAFFDVHPDTIERIIRKRFNKTFTEFRDENMVYVPRR